MYLRTGTRATQISSGFWIVYVCPTCLVGSCASRRGRRVGSHRPLRLMPGIIIATDGSPKLRPRAPLTAPKSTHRVLRPAVPHCVFCHGPERCPAPWRHSPRRRSFRRNCTITPRPSVRGGDDGPWDWVWPAAPEYRSDTGDGQRTIPRRGGGSESMSRLQVGERRGRCACGGWSGGGSAGRCAHCTRPSCLVPVGQDVGAAAWVREGLEDVLRHFVRASPPGSDRPGRYCDGARRRGERGGPRRWPRPP